jgi:hypothetical protein
MGAEIEELEAKSNSRDICCKVGQQWIGQSRCSKFYWLSALLLHIRRAVRQNIGSEITYYDRNYA